MATTLPPAPTAGPPLRTPAFVLEIFGQKIQLFYERPWVTWLNQLQSQIDNIDELTLQSTQDSAAAEGAAERFSLTESLHSGRATLDELLHAQGSPQQLIDLIADRVLNMAVERHFEDPMAEQELLGLPPDRSWTDFVMRQAAGVIALEGTSALFPGLRRSATNPLNTASTLANKSALTGHEVLDEAYGAPWNGKIEAPTKNAVYDKIEALNLASGVYTPALFNTANLTASTAYECQYLRVGNTVTVSGRVDIDPTAAAATVLGISLPIASNIGASEDCAGVAFASGIAGQGAAILGDAANDRASMQWVAVDLTNQAMFFTFSYQII